MQYTRNLTGLLQMAKPQFAYVEFVNFMGGRRNRRVRHVAAVQSVMARRRQMGVNVTHG